jgi:hypothetical protein
MSLSAARGDVPPDWPEGAGWVELIDHGYIDSGPEAGNWEYVYDFYGGTNTFPFSVHLLYDAMGTVNVWEDGTGRTVSQNWCAMSAGIPRPFSGTWTDPDFWPSNWEDTDADSIRDAWVPNADPWGMINEWHTGDEYTVDMHCWNDITVDATGMHFDNANGFISNAWMVEGLSNTFRVVHPYAPGEITYNIWHVDAALLEGTVIGPVPEPATLALLSIGGVALLKSRRKS